MCVCVCVLFKGVCKWPKNNPFMWNGHPCKYKYKYKYIYPIQIQSIFIWFSTCCRYVGTKAFIIKYKSQLFDGLLTMKTHKMEITFDYE